MVDTGVEGADEIAELLTGALQLPIVPAQGQD